MRKESNQQIPQEFIDLFAPITLDRALKKTVIFVNDIPESGANGASLTKHSEMEGRTYATKVRQGGAE